jgi:hypothetical protein
MEKSELELMQEQFQAVLKEITQIKEVNEELRDTLGTALNEVEIQKARNALLIENQNQDSSEAKITIPLKDHEQLLAKLRCLQQMRAASVDNEAIQRLKFATLKFLLNEFASYAEKYNNPQLGVDEAKVMFLAHFEKIIKWYAKNLKVGIEARKNAPDIQPNGDIVDGVTGALIDHLPSETTLREITNETK